MRTRSSASSVSTRTTPRTLPRSADRAGRLLLVALAVLAAACGQELRLGTETIPQRTARERPAPRPAPKPASRARRPTAQRPAITARPIPFDATRVRQTVAYSQRHYGRRTAR